ncbi:MAG TPA: P-type DNA transfer ATPase VirB11 [Steroidobacteraceae bacterium]|nr:P-type DNA transfer ATPase VirB11 [Steroidobacteraceae bacterium]
MDERPAAGGRAGSDTAGALEYASALELLMRPLRPLLSRPDVMEICINRPSEVFLETSGGWRREPAGYADLGWCRRFAKLVANFSRQRIDETSPLLSASLPSGERVQIALPPATTQGCVAVNIRRPSQEVWSVGELTRRGTFSKTRAARSGPEEVEIELRGLLAQRRYEAFMRLAVRSRRNILVSGPTGSGKTTWTKALIREIPPHERLVTIEDAPELVLDRHPNHVRLFYSKDDQGLARVTPKQLLEATLRMKPDRILLAELRAEEAFDYLRNVNSGHPGSITSIHASSAALAFEQLVLLVKQSEGGRQLARRDIRSLLRRLIDVVIQCGVEGHERYIQEIWYRPRSAAAALPAPASPAEPAGC